MQPTPPNALPRVLGPWIATALIVGTVIGSGVFKKGRNVADNVPEFGMVMAVWVLGGVLALLGALALAEVAVMFPKAGGNYVYLREGYGRWAGFLWGWVDFWIIRAASIAALATMFTESFHDVLRQSLHPGEKVEVLAFWPRQLLTASVIAALTWLNVRGTALSGKFQFGITLVKVASLLFIICAPFAIYALVAEPSHPPRAAHLVPVLPQNGINLSGFGVALVGVLWAYNGWMNIAPIAEEVKEPSRNIPRALLLAVFTLIALYCGANLAYHLVLPHAAITSKTNNELSNTPLATEFCEALLGPVGVVLASAIVMTSVFGALNGNLLVGPRLLYAMGRDRLAPSSFAQVHAQYRTPAVAIVAMAAWSALLVLCVGALTQYRVPVLSLGFAELDLNVPAGKSPFDIMTDFVIFGSVTFETLAVATIFVFRRRLPRAERPYRCWGYPVVPALYVLIMLAVLFNMFAAEEQRSEAVIGAAFIATGAAVYALFLRTRAGGERPA